MRLSAPVGQLGSQPEFVAALGVALLYLATMSGHLHSIDGYLMWQQACALAFHHTLAFEPPIAWETHTFKTSYFAIGLSVLYVPGLLIWSVLNPAAAAQMTPQVGGIGMYADPLYPALGAPWHAFVTAATGYLVARLIRQLGFGTGTALFGLALYCLASLALVYSHGDYAQSLEGLWWTGALCAALSVRRSRSWAAAVSCGAAVCFAVLTRTMEGALLVPAVLLTLVPGGYRSRRLHAYQVKAIALVITGLLIGLGVTLLVDQIRYGDPLETGYGTSGGRALGLWSTPLVIGLAGALVSPARGILWAMPAVLLAPFGLRRLWASEHRMLGIGMVLASSLLLLSTAKWYAWWGGLDWGLRLYLPAFPLLAVLSAIGAHDRLSHLPAWLIGVLFLGGLVCAVPGIATDALAGYGGLADDLGSFRWDAYPPIGAWQFVKYPFPTTTVDTAVIDIFWLRLIYFTGGLSLVPMACLLAGAFVCAGRVSMSVAPGFPGQVAVAVSHRISRVAVKVGQLAHVCSEQVRSRGPELRCRILCFLSSFSLAGILTLATLLVIAASTRFYRLDYYSLWLDETVQYGWATAPLGAILFKLQPDQMFLNTFLSHFLIRANLGETIWQLRLPSALAGVATVVAMWRLGHALFGRSIGVVTGLLAALWPVFVVYSQEYRPYSIEVLLACLTLLFLVRGYQTNRAIWWALLAMAAVLFLYNHMTSVVALAAVACAPVIWLAMDVVGVPGFTYTGPRANFGRHIGALVTAAGLILVGYLPGLMILANFLEMSDSVAYITGVKTPLVLNQSTLATIFGKSLGLGDGLPLVVTGGLALLGLAWSLRSRPHAAALALAAIGVPLLIFSHTGGGGSVLNSPRYVLFLAPMYLLLVAAGNVRLSLFLARTFAVRSARFTGWPYVRNVLLVAPSVLLIVPMLAGLKSAYESNPKEIPMDLRAAYQYVLDRVVPGDVIVQSSTSPGMPAQWFDYYDDYFLRDRRPGYVLFARFGQDWGRPEPVCLTLKLTPPQKACLSQGELGQSERVSALPTQFTLLDNTRGRVWVMVTTRAAGEADLRETLGMREGNTVVCFTGICVLGPTHDQPPPLALAQLTAYLRELAAVAS